MLADRIDVAVPAGFVRLSPERIQEKYAGDKRPSEVLTDNDDAYFKIMEMPQRVSANEVGQYKSFHMSQMKKESNIEWLFDDYQKSVNGNWGIIKVIYPSLQRYVHYFFTSMDGKLLLMSFECNAKDWKKYEGIGDAIYQSIKVR
ncbi:MAG: hypothetical protein ABW007_18745 [Chitinophagaceae bacterium]